MATVLLVDDKENIRRVMGAILKREGYSVVEAADGREALATALRKRPDLILSDVRMDGMNGIELFSEIRSRGMDTPFVLMTAFATVPEAVDAIRDGAIHYLSKPVDYPELLRTIARAIAGESARTHSERSETRSLVGSGAAMKRLLDRIDSVADSDATVSLHGENGTGKELVARALHRKSRRRDGPFVAVHCASFNPNLLESELFGYESGAFTGATRRKEGYFEAARGGTLFLDEVSEISGELQVKLLRVLQERAFTRVGDTTLVRADFRLIAATNRDLASMVAGGRFREDLYYRLEVVPVHVPPLRERLEDIEELARHFAGRVAVSEGLAVPELSAGFLTRLLEHSWPGNVRELENLMERVLVVYRPDVLTARHLEEEDPGRFPPATLQEPDGSITEGSETDRQRLIEALKQSGGNRTKAARLLGVSRRTLYYWIDRCDLKASGHYGSDSSA
jgi:DNA-binding NtrC family response regulator